MEFEMIIIIVLIFFVIALLIGLIVCYISLSKLKKENNDLKEKVKKLKKRAINNYTLTD